MPELVGSESQERLTEKALKLMKVENARVFKWKEMLTEYPEKRNPKLKERARKGIPDAMRGYAWKILIDGARYLNTQQQQQSEGSKASSKLFKTLMEQQGD